MRGACAGNDRATEAHFDQLISDRAAEVRAGVAFAGWHRVDGIPTTEQLSTLARDRSERVYWNVLNAPRVPETALQFIIEHSDGMNQLHARTALDRGPVQYVDVDADDFEVNIDEGNRRTRYVTPKDRMLASRTFDESLPDIDH